MYFNQTSIGLFLFRHALCILFKLSSDSIPGWDTRYAQEVVDLPHVLDLLAQRFEESAETGKINRASGNGEGDFFAILVRRLRWVKNWYMHKSETQQSAESQLDKWITGDIFGFLDESLWQEP